MAAAAPLPCEYQDASLSGKALRRTWSRDSPENCLQMVPSPSFQAHRGFTFHCGVTTWHASVGVVWPQHAGPHPISPLAAAATSERWLPHQPGTLHGQDEHSPLTELGVGFACYCFNQPAPVQRLPNFPFLIYAILRKLMHGVENLIYL